MTKFQLPSIKYDKMIYMILGIMMLLSLAPMMQAYSMIMNVVVFAMCAWMSFNSWRAHKMDNMWFIVFAIIAVIFNPLMILNLGMQMWMMLKILFTLMFFYMFFNASKKAAK